MYTLTTVRGLYTLMRKAVIKDGQNQVLMEKWGNWNNHVLLVGAPWKFFFKILFIYFQREVKGGRKRETSMWEKYWSVASHTCCPGTEPTTQRCVPTGNWTGDLSLCGRTPNQLSHTSQGSLEIFNEVKHKPTHCVSYSDGSSVDLGGRCWLLCLLYKHSQRKELSRWRLSHRLKLRLPQCAIFSHH